MTLRQLAMVSAMVVSRRVEMGVWQLAGWCMLLIAVAEAAKPPNMVFMLMDDVSCARSYYYVPAVRVVNSMLVQIKYRAYVL